MSEPSSEDNRTTSELPPKRKFFYFDTSQKTSSYVRDLPQGEKHLTICQAKALWQSLCYIHGKL